MNDYLRIIIICAASVAVGLLAGNGAVFFFNKMPGRWLCDYGEEPTEELLHPSSQRIKGIPWRYVLSGLFIGFSIKLGLESPAYAFAAVAAMWIMTEIALADAKYMIIPDQLTVLLAVSALGFIPHHARGALDCAVGAVIGLGLMVIIALIGKLFSKDRTPGAGGGDIKLFTAIGLVTGSDGVIMIFLLTVILSAAHLAWLAAKGRADIKSKRPLAPYAAIAMCIYLFMLHGLAYDFILRL